LIISGGSTIKIFDRLAKGDDKPLRTITNVRVGADMAVYPQGGKIALNVPGPGDEDRDEVAAFTPEGLASDKAHVAVWSIYDDGPVPPMMASASAPPSGTRSLVMPSIVGQK